MLISEERHPFALPSETHRWKWSWSSWSMELLWVWKTCMEVVSHRFLPILFFKEPSWRSGQKPPRRWARQRSESEGKQKISPFGSGSEGTYPCGAQAPMWWLNGHFKMRLFQMRRFQRKSAKRSWQRMMTSSSSSRHQKQQQGSVFWSGNLLWIMRIVSEGTPCTWLWHLTNGQTFLESLWTRLMPTNWSTIYWKRVQIRSRSFAVSRRAVDAFEVTSILAISMIRPWTSPTWRQGAENVEN